MPKIRPITDLRNTGEISELCHTSEEPIFITKNGYGDMVVMSIEAYERDQAAIDTYRKLGGSEKMLQNGVKPLDGKTFFDGLRSKYGY
jgi:prevent-host-death family protein